MKNHKENLRVVIVEDEYPAGNYLKNMIDHHFSDLEVVDLCLTMGDALIKIQNLNPDIIFLDISLGSENAFEILDQISYLDFALIVTTASESHALKAIKYEVVDYLLKPIGLQDLKIAVAKAIFKIQKQQQDKNIHPEKLILSSSGSLEFFNYQEIVLIKSENVYSLLQFTNGQTKLVSKSIGYLEKVLPQSVFSRVHNSYIINHHHIVKYIKDGNGTIILNGDILVPVAKSRKQDFLNRINIF